MEIIVIGVLCSMIIGLNIMLRKAWSERDQARAELAALESRISKKGGW